VAIIGSLVKIAAPKSKTVLFSEPDGWYGCVVTDDAGFGLVVDRRRISQNSYSKMYVCRIILSGKIGWLDEMHLITVALPYTLYESWHNLWP